MGGAAQYAGSVTDRVAPLIDRRILLSVLLTPSLASCAQTGGDGRLTARPRKPVGTAKTGLQPLDLGAPRDGLLYVPASYEANEPAPLLVFLHGAGGKDRYGIDLLRSHSEAFGFILLSPASRSSTWDGIATRLGPDVTFLNSALQRTFETCHIDARRIGIGGFSDGASYALTLGVTNGDLFTHVLAFSPGFMSPPSATGRPHIFISHGTRDQVLPIEQCSRRIVPRLKRAGYEVDYREFDGPHTVPAALSKAAVEEVVKQF